jgi:hypothetical protein
MAHVELDIEDTSLYPERVISALTDFSERRPEIWPPRQSRTAPG